MSGLCLSSVVWVIELFMMLKTLDFLVKRLLEFLLYTVTGCGWWLLLGGLCLLRLLLLWRLLVAVRCSML